MTYIIISIKYVLNVISLPNTEVLERLNNPDI